MQGARDYFNLFSGQSFLEGKLLVKFGSHARGTTMHIWVVTEDYKGGVTGFPGPANGVEVYGIRGGQPGWTEYYGWLHEGPWQEDFMRIVERKREEKKSHEDTLAQAASQAAAKDLERMNKILSSYSQ